MLDKTHPKEIDINALAAHIRGKLHGGSCPGQGALGELAYIQEENVNGNTRLWQAWMYAWKDHLSSTDIAGWFCQFGCADVNIFHQLHDTDNDILEGKSTSDGVRPLMIYFTTPATKVDIASSDTSAPVDPSLSHEIYRACEVLPEGWEIRIELEKDHGVVVLVDPHGGDHELPADGLLSDAMRISIEGALDGHRQGIA